MRAVLRGALVCVTVLLSALFGALIPRVLQSIYG